MRSKEGSDVSDCVSFSEGKTFPLRLFIFGVSSTSVYLTAVGDCVTVNMKILGKDSEGALGVPDKLKIENLACPAHLTFQQIFYP